MANHNKLRPSDLWHVNNCPSAIVQQDVKHIELTADITKAKHFTSHEARFNAVDQLANVHGWQGECLYSYVVVHMFGRRMFVKEIY